jgi:hypothetical protein
MKTTALKFTIIICLHATNNVSCLLHAGFLLGLLFDTKETSADFHMTTQRYIPKGETLQWNVAFKHFVALTYLLVHISYFSESQESADHWTVNQSSGLSSLMTSLFMFTKHNSTKRNPPRTYQVMIFSK